MVGFLALMIGSASAGSLGLDPQNRLHFGINVVDLPSPIGLTFGFDSRLTRYLSMDVGAFASPFSIPLDYTAEDAENSELYHMRHGVYLTPGIRIPHVQPRAFAWELYLRGGGGVVWATNVDPAVAEQGDGEWTTRVAPGGLGGADVLFRFGKYGVRVFGKAWIFGAQHTSPDVSYVLLRPQYGMEAVYQW